MGRIPENIISDVLDRADMLQIIGEYVRLKRAGRNYKGLCPFHGEKTPSFTVSPDQGFFKCFGCGAGGTLYSFLMQIEGWSFPEAVRHVAGRVGIEVPELKREDADKARARRKARDRYQHIMGLAQQWFEANMWKGPWDIPREYLKGRGVDEEAARAFGLGYAPEGWSGLLDNLKKHNISPKAIEEAGLVVPGQRGHYDRFRDRIIFPVVDIWGKTLAFGGRRLNDDPEAKIGAKYINSPETAFYTKGSELYGLAATKRAIRAEGSALLVEGNFDVVTLYAKGVQNAVAPMGTALTERQVRLLARYTKRAYVAFDGDKAGQAAILKALPMLMAHNFDARVVAMPPGEDPDSLIQKHGQEALTEAIERARPIVAYALDGIINPLIGAPIEERIAGINDAAEVMRHVDNRMVWQHYTAEMARRLDVPPKEVERALRNHKARAERKEKQRAQNSARTQQPRQEHSSNQRRPQQNRKPAAPQQQRPQQNAPAANHQRRRPPAGPPSGPSGPQAPPPMDNAPPPGAMGPGLDGPPPWGPPPEMDGPPPEAFGPPSDMDMAMNMGAPTDGFPSSGPPMSDGGSAPAFLEAEQEVAPTVRTRIPRLEGQCLQLLVDLPDRFAEFFAEGCCQLLTDERLVHLLERVHERLKEGEKGPQYALVAQQLGEELGDQAFFQQISALLVAERPYNEVNIEQNYLDVITRMQMRWIEEEEKNIARQMRTVDTRSPDLIKMLMRKRELDQLRAELDTRLQRKKG
mgnify:CR=1 FL=1